MLRMKSEKDNRAQVASSLILIIIRKKDFHNKAVLFFFLLNYQKKKPTCDLKWRKIYKKEGMGKMGNKDRLLQFPHILIYTLRTFSVGSFSQVIYISWHLRRDYSDRWSITSYTCHRNRSSDIKLIFATGEIVKKWSLPCYKWIQCALETVSTLSIKKLPYQPNYDSSHYCNFFSLC